MAGSGRLQHLENGARILRPNRRLGAELFSTLGSELVVLRLPVVLRKAPLCLDPTSLFHAVEGGVEGALFYLKALVRGFADPRRDGVSVTGPPRQRFQDEEVERALEKIEIDGSHGVPLNC